MENYQVENLKEYIDTIDKIQTRCMEDFCFSQKRPDNTEKNIKEANKELKKYFTAVSKKAQKLYECSLEKNKTSFEEKFNVFYDDRVKFFYRGHRDIKYKLLPSVFRKNNWEYEDVYFHEMIAHCPNYFQYNSHLDKLVTMQHYDCPTRLLDITSNPLIALYFACNDPSNEKNPPSIGEVNVFFTLSQEIVYSDSDKALILSCLPRFNKNEKNILLQKANEFLDNGKFEQIMDNSEYLDEFVEKLYHEITNEAPAFKRELVPLDLLKPLFIQPNKTNARIIKQDGAFIISGLSANVHDATKKLEALVCAKIKIKNKKSILKDLSMLGIHEASLFPEVDKVAHFLRENIEDEKMN